MSDINSFEKDLANIINEHSIESMVDMPDFILAKLITMYVISLAYAFEEKKVYFNE